MGLGQTLLTIMALMLMGRLILNSNTLTLDTGMMKDLAEYRIAGTSFGTSRLEKIEGKRFDESSVDSIEVYTTSELSTYANFGPGRDAGESSTNEATWDDVDDYHTVAHYDTINWIPYKDSVIVEYDTLYYNAGPPVVAEVRKTTNKSFTKRIIVRVTGPYLIDYTSLIDADGDGEVDDPKPDTLRFERIIGYWYMR
ncbi:MAG: hypothetical protein Q8L88_09675 [Bacteroidota bacterium]|nr:hypothetical protein [Bacteroidota bacterium]